MRRPAQAATGDDKQRIHLVYIGDRVRHEGHGIGLERRFTGGCAQTNDRQPVAARADPFLARAGEGQRSPGIDRDAVVGPECGQIRGAVKGDGGIRELTGRQTADNRQSPLVALAVKVAPLVMTTGIFTPS